MRGEPPPDSLIFHPGKQLRQKSLTLRISLQRDLLVVKIQIGKVVAEFAGLPENLTEVDPIKALFSSVLSGKLQSFKKMFSGNFPPDSYFIYLRNF